jgi:hypothetical protein
LVLTECILVVATKRVQFPLLCDYRRVHPTGNRFDCQIIFRQILHFAWPLPFRDGVKRKPNLTQHILSLQKEGMVVAAVGCRTGRVVEELGEGCQQ